MSAAPPAATAAPTTTTPATTTPAVTPPAVIKDEITDTQTGKKFVKLPEQWYDIASAWFSAAYSLFVIGYLTFMVLYMLSGKPDFWPQAMTNMLGTLLTGPVSKLILYTAIGGAMGAAVNNLRSFISWHAEDKAFGWRFIWKYIAMPPLGGTLAVLVYGILQGGIAVINGGTPPESSQLTSLSAWAAGTLAGYGSSKVFIWLDDKVNTLFKIDKKPVAVPDVTGKTEDEAKQILNNAQLSVGTVTKQTVSSAEAGKVITQAPGAGTQIDCGSKVDLTVGVAAPTDEVNPTIDPALTGTTQNGNGTPKNGSGVIATDTTTSSTETTATTGTTNTSGTTDTTAIDTTATDTTATDTTDTTATDTTAQPTDDEPETATVGNTTTGNTDTGASG